MINHYDAYFMQRFLEYASGNGVEANRHQHTLMSIQSISTLYPSKTVIRCTLDLHRLAPDKCWSKHAGASMYRQFKVIDSKKCYIKNKRFYAI